MARRQTQVNLKSVFNNGENTITKNNFTKKWIALINTIEENKKASVSKHK